MEQRAGPPSVPGLPSVSVIVPTYRRAGRLEASLRAVLADSATSELVVAVDGSNDGSFELARRLGDEDRRVVALDLDHRGKQAAMTAALEQASGEVVLLLDDDVIAGPGLVEGHARRHLGSDRLVVVGYMPCVEPAGASAEGTAKGTALPLFTRLYAEEYEAHCRAIEADPSLVLLRLWGGNVSLRRADCARVGFADWALVHEDQLFGIECLEAGLRGVFDRGLYAEHRHVRDVAGFLRNSRSQGAGQWYLRRRYPDLLGAPDLDWASEGLPSPARRLVRFFGTERRCSLATGPLVAAARGARRLHAGAVEVGAYRLARRVEMQTGASIAAGGTHDPAVGL